ncbi:MAG: tetratricopeptide repeat protein [Ignavibacteriae bacterium]|nr:tetratricopeptide repeat protein [Ignavibacteriota bacterium]
MPVVETILVKALSLLGKYSKEKLESNVRYQLIIRELGLDIPTLKPDFQSVYVSALVRFAENKHADILKLFAFEDVQTAYRQELYDGDTGKTLIALDHFLHTNTQVHELKNVNVDVEKELEQFSAIFVRMVRQSRTPSELEQFSLLKQIDDGVKSILSRSAQVTESINLEYIAQKAPKVPNDFIERKHKTNIINGMLSQKPLLFIHGVTRSTKTFLVSQYVSDFNIANYYWYDFKVNQGVGDNFIFNDLVHFLDSVIPNANVKEKWISRELSLNKLVTLCTEQIHGSTFQLIVLDNIQSVSVFNGLFAFLEILLKESNGSIKVILISEDRDTLNPSATLALHSNVMELNGFDEEEIMELMKASGCNVEGVNENLLTLIRVGTSGHPDFINGLITEINSAASTRHTVAVLVEKVIAGWKNVGGSEAITEAIANRIYNVHLQTTDGKRMFNRLCALTGQFSGELAEYLASIDPKVADAGMIFQLISNKFLDVYPNSRFSVPTLFQRVGINNLSSDEKRNIHSAAADYLFTPRRGTVDFKDATQSCFYFLMAGKIDEVLRRCGLLLSRIILEDKDITTIRYVINELNIFFNLDLEPKYNNQYLLILILALKTYHQLKDVKNQDRILAKVLAMPTSSLDPVNRLFRHIYLIYHYSHDPERSEQSINCAIKMVQIITQERLPKELTDPKFMNQVLSVPFYFIARQEKPRIDLLVLLVKAYSAAKIELSRVFRKKELSDFFQILFTKLYRNLSIDPSRVTTLEEAISDLEELRNLFEVNAHLSATRDISYLIGCLLNDLSNDCHRTLQHFDRAKNTHVSSDLSDNKILAEIIVGMADCYYKSKDYKSALMKYEESIKIFETSNIKDFLLLHTYRRAAISQSELGLNMDAKKNFFKALSMARNLGTRREQNSLETLGDMSTFYIHINEYYNSAKCFSIMVSMLNNPELAGYMQIISHSLGWLTFTLDGNWDGKLVNPDGTKSNEPWVKPYFGMYNKTLDYRSPELSIIKVKLLLATTLAHVGLPDKGISIFEQVSMFSLTKSNDKILAVGTLMKFHPYLKSLRDLKSAFRCIVNQFRLLNEINDVELPTSLRDKNFFDTILTLEVIPVVNSIIEKYDNQISFTRAEDSLLYFLARCDELSEPSKSKLCAFIMSVLGWLYGQNQHLQSDYQGKAANWLFKSHRLAIVINYLYVIIHNRIYFDFILTVEIRDLSKFVKRNFETFYLIMQNWIDAQYFVELFSKHFFRLWLSISPPDGEDDSQDVDIVSKIQSVLRGENIVELDFPDRTVIITSAMMKLDQECNFDPIKLKVVIEVCFDMLTDKTKHHLESLLEVYHQVAKRAIVSNLQNIGTMVSLAQKAVDTLETLAMKPYVIANPAIQLKLEEIIREMNVLSGKLL